MKQYNLFLLIIVCLSYSCGPTEQEQKQREQEIADSVAKMLTGKPLSDPENSKRIEKFKNTSSSENSIVTADSISLKNIGLEYDYDNKLFNKNSDVDGKLYNRSDEITYKNIQLKVVCKDKNGRVMKSFIHTEYNQLSPGAVHKFRIKFEDRDKSRNASVFIVGAEECL